MALQSMVGPISLNSKYDSSVASKELKQTNQPISTTSTTTTNDEYKQKEISQIRNYSLVNKIGDEGIGYGKFISPMDITVDSEGYVYVTDLIGSIQKFDRNGNFITQWGDISAYGIAVDSSGYVYVTDDYRFQIQKFDSNGTFITKWGSFGMNNGEFHEPYGIAVDSSCYVYVTDSKLNNIQKFDSKGAFIAKWGNEGFQDGQFKEVHGIAVDYSIGYVYVIDSGNYCIQKFSPIQVPK